jgi:hypothetical protein
MRAAQGHLVVVYIEKLSESWEPTENVCLLMNALDMEALAFVCNN